MPLGHKDHFELKAVFFCLVGVFRLVGFLFCFYLGFFWGGGVFFVLFFILKADLKKQTPKKLSGLHLFPKSGAYTYKVVFRSPF